MVCRVSHGLGGDDFWTSLMSPMSPMSWVLWWAAADRLAFRARTLETLRHCQWHQLSSLNDFEQGASRGILWLAQSGEANQSRQSFFSLPICNF